MGTILTAKKVTKRFGGLVAVNAFDLLVEENSISSVIGPNGAGKTTFFNCITGFYVPEEGEIIFDGHRIQGLSTDRVTRFGIARTYQNIRLVREYDRARKHPRRGAPQVEDGLGGVGPANTPVRGRRESRRWRKPNACCNLSVCRVLGIPWRPICLTAHNDGLKSPGPSPASQNCCCWTSQRPG